MPIDFTSTNPEDAGPTMMPLPPAELEQRKTGWRALLARAEDPNVRSAILQTGIGLMRSPQYGQSGWDVGANALQAGVGTLQQLREHDRILAEQKAEIARKQAQTGIENTRADRQVTTGERNAATQEKSVGLQEQNLTADNSRADKALSETERHNKANEAADAERAKAARIAADSKGPGRAGKTSAEIEKINRLAKYYQQQNPSATPEEIDKMAIDYVTNSKGKPPRQLVIEQFNNKVKNWMDQQFDPTAKPTPELFDQWKKEAIQEITTLEDAGKDITDRRGVIARPGSAPPATPAAPGAAVAPPTAAAATPNPATLRSIEKWKAKAGTPEQIKILIAAGGEDPKIYGY